MLAASRELLTNGMVILPYIISSNVTKFQQRKSLNKKESLKLESCALYSHVKEKYKSDRIDKEILQWIATIISSEFKIIAYNNPELDGKIISNVPDSICEEICMFILLI